MHWSQLQTKALNQELTSEELDSLRKHFFSSPPDDLWSNVLSKLGLFFGVGLVLLGVIFIVAFNWAALGVLTKLSMAGGLFLASALAALLFRGRQLTGQVLMGMTGLCIGPLLILYTQTYQSGANPWGLFLIWALFALPWVALSRLPGMWVLIWLLVRTCWLCMLMDMFRMEPEQIFGVLLTATLVDLVAWIGWRYVDSGYSKIPVFFFFATLVPFPTIWYIYGYIVPAIATLILVVTSALAIFFEERSRLYLPLIAATSVGISLNIFFCTMSIDVLDEFTFWLSGFGFMAQAMATAIWLRFRMMEANDVVLDS